MINFTINIKWNDKKNIYFGSVTIKKLNIKKIRIKDKYTKRKN